MIGNLFSYIVMEMIDRWSAGLEIVFASNVITSWQKYAGERGTSRAPDLERPEVSSVKTTYPYQEQCTVIIPASVDLII